MDLTVLLVFLNLMRFRKATDVAQHMGLTQSSISHSIKRLRDAFGDPLFLRISKGMEPTAVALTLEPKIREVVETLSSAMADPISFQPEEAQGTFRIGAYDNEMATLVPDLIRKVKARAPGLRVSVLALGRRHALEALGNREIDLALGFIWDLPKEFERAELYHENYRVVCRAGHPLADRLSELETYCQASHLVVSPAGDFTGIVDVELEKQGLKREVVASLPLFLPALALVSSSDMVATLPGRLVRRNAGLFRLAACEPPIKIRPFPVSAIWHARDARNPIHEWIVGLMSPAD